MGERAKVILNEYSAKNLLMRDTLDLDKFYTADLKLFVEVARKEIERLNNMIERLNNQLQQKDNILKEVRNWINSTIDIIKQQPTGNDEWILERLNSFISLLDKGE